MSLADLLESIYLDALRCCDPRALMRAALERSPRRSFGAVIAIGKAAVPLVEGFLDVHPEIERIFVAAPKGYAETHEAFAVHEGGHPDLTDASFAAGEALMSFVAQLDTTVAVIVSGGASACVEVPLDGVSREELVTINRALVRSGEPIENINCVRKHLSAIKGGRIAQRLSRGSTTFVYSDVPRGKEWIVGSGPSVADPTTREEAAAILRRLDTPNAKRLATLLERGELPESPKHVDSDSILIADNATLVSAAASAVRERGLDARVIDGEIEGDVGDAAHRLFDIAASLPPKTIAVAGGETTVKVMGRGIGGRCSELAARFTLLALDDERELTALFGSSDGVDGASPAAAVVADPQRYRTSGITALDISVAIRSSDTFSLAEKCGKAIRIQPTGNNLRDLFLLARG